MEFSPQFSHLDVHLKAVNTRFIRFSLVAKRLKRLAPADYVAFGPWVGEVGWEVLYWIPFVNWVIKQYGLEKKKLYVVSRGGNSSWYRSMGVEFEYLPVETYMPEIKQKLLAQQDTNKGMKKEKVVSTLDLAMDDMKRAVSTVEGRSMKGPAFFCVSPDDMYALSMPFAGHHLGFRYLLSCQDQPAAPVNRQGESACEYVKSLELPERFVTLRLYNRASLTYSRELVLGVLRFTRSLCQRTKSGCVILVYPHDTDHSEVFDGAALAMEECRALDPTVVELSKTDNLDVQTEILLRSAVTITTHGGLAYLSAWCGNRVYAIDDSAFTKADHHLMKARRAFGEQGSITLIDPETVM